MNPSFAIDLISQVPPKECTQRVVYCNGGGGSLGHPKVYINLVNSLLVVLLDFFCLNIDYKIVTYLLNYTYMSGRKYFRYVP